MLLVDQNDWFTQMDRREELKETESNIEYLKGEIEKMSAELEKVQNIPEVANQYAREKYFHKKADEDLFIITQDTVYIQDSVQ